MNIIMQRADIKAVSILKGENLGVTLIIAPIRNMSANHKMYVNEDGSTYYGDPVNVATGAFIQEIHAFTNSVGDSLLDLSYDSRKAAEIGEAGRGLDHSIIWSFKNLIDLKWF